MKILIVSATELEIKPLKEYLNRQKNNNTIKLLHTGMGSFNTIYFLTKKITQNKYDLLINAGIAGSYNRKLQLGKVVKVKTDYWYDLSIENEQTHQSFFETKLLDANQFPFKNGYLHTDKKSFDLFPNIPSVKAISSDTVHGNPQTIENIQQQYCPDIETMEGAAFFFTCIHEKAPFVAIRSISNYVEKRNRKKWKIELAINNLNKVLIDFLNDYS